MPSGTSLGRAVPVSTSAGGGMACRQELAGFRERLDLWYGHIDVDGRIGIHLQGASLFTWWRSWARKSTSWPLPRGCRPRPSCRGAQLDQDGCPERAGGCRPVKHAVEDRGSASGRQDRPCAASRIRLRSESASFIDTVRTRKQFFQVGDGARGPCPSRCGSPVRPQRRVQLLGVIIFPAASPSRWRTQEAQGDRPGPTEWCSTMFRSSATST